MGQSREITGAKEKLYWSSTLFFDCRAGGKNDSIELIRSSRRRGRHRNVGQGGDQGMPECFSLLRDALLRQARVHL